MSPVNPMLNEDEELSYPCKMEHLEYIQGEITSTYAKMVPKIASKSASNDPKHKC